MSIQPLIAAEPETAPELPRETARRRWGRRVGESLLVLIGASIVTVLITWPQARNMSETAPHDPGDTTYFAWQLAWVGHALLTDPSRLWTTNAYLQTPDNLAFTDTVLGYAPLSMLGLGGEGQAGALFVLNLAGLLASVVAFSGAYCLARVLGSRVPGGLVAGAGFAFALWRLPHIIHINVISVGGMALALAFLAKGHGWTLRHGWRPETMSGGWVFAGWLVACWQITMGFAIGIPFGYALGAICLLWALGWLIFSRRRLPTRFLIGHGVGGLLFGGVVLALMRPYLRVVEAHPEGARNEGMLGLFSPPWRGLITAAEDSQWYGDYFAPWRENDIMFWQIEQTLLPGFLIIALGVLGLVYSSWPLKRRIGLLLGIGVALVLTMGVRFFWEGEYTYLPLYHHAPGWEALRTPGRLIIWVTLGLCLLAAGFMTKITDRVWPRPEDAAAVAVDQPGTDRLGDDRLGDDERVEQAVAEPSAAPAESGSTGLAAAERSGAEPAADGAPYRDLHSTAVVEDERLFEDRKPVAEPAVQAAPDSEPDPEPDPEPDGAPAAPTRVRRRAARKLSPVMAIPLALLLALPAAAVTIEGRGNTEHIPIYPAPYPFETLPEPILMLPTDFVGDYHNMLWSTKDFPIIANGSASFDSEVQKKMREEVKGFPDQFSVAAVRARGIATVVLIRAELPGSPWAGADAKPIEGLGILRQDLGDVVVFDVR